MTGGILPDGARGGTAEMRPYFKMNPLAYLTISSFVLRRALHCVHFDFLLFVDEMRAAPHRCHKDCFMRNRSELGEKANVLWAADFQNQGLFLCPALSSLWLAGSASSRCLDIFLCPYIGLTSADLAITYGPE